MKYNILIGGSAGQGMDTIATILKKILQKNGYYIFLNKDYMSRVRGGHNFIQIRFSKDEVFGYDNELDAIIALDKNTVDIHLDKLKTNGILITDESNLEDDKNDYYEYKLKELAKELKNIKMVNIIALGCLLKIFGVEINCVKDILKKIFINDNIVDINFEAFKKGYDLAKNKFNIEKGSLKESILINGNDVVGLSAIASGVSFYSAYPMTPSTGVMNYIAKKANDANILVEQAEDEIASINMALGASYAGARAMTGSSGGGLALMCESLGLVSIMETPLVVIDVQRPGPATGLPTRTEQSDLSFLLTASHGEIPRIIIALTDQENAFYQTSRAFNLADKYQTLVILLSDQFLADSNKTIKDLDFDKITIDRYIEFEKTPNYKRYDLENNISKRRIPGLSKDYTVITGSNEHNEYGNITEDKELRVKMMKKRMGKLDLIKNDLIEPIYYGTKNPKNLIMGWGSTIGAIKEAIDILNKEKDEFGALIFSDIYPLPTKKLLKYAKNAVNIINIEQNYTGQLAKLIRSETGIHCNKSILKYDGRQINYKEIVSQIEKEVF
ncbi:MAG: 2-oxoacid:acceptor oxidoreductase subunit alpha [Peptostreptococcaceae bacterium]|nr:2-oxoacid:acceptor oxidoreductase subunit alpha [Peptostreptococcaceae bacterium]